MLKRCLSLCLTIILILSLTSLIVNADGELLEINYNENNAPVKNPAKGLIYTLWNPESIVIDAEDLRYFSGIYIRWNWSKLEPNEGEFKWDIIDKYIEVCKKYDLKLYFGVMNQDLINGYSTPKWVFDRGANFVECYCGMPGNTSVTTYVPIWNDSVFLEKYNNFVQALAQRYDNEPVVEGITLLGYGTYGEGVPGSRMYKKDKDIPTISLDEQWSLIHKPYLDNFKNKKIIYECVTNQERAIQEGVDIIKKNSLLGGNSEEGFYLGKLVNDRVQVMHEFYTSYENMSSSNIGPIWANNLFMDELIKAKSSYATFALSREWFYDNLDMFKIVSQRIGYNFIMKQAKLPNSSNANEHISVNFKFENNGISKLYDNCIIKLAILNRNDEIVRNFVVDGVNPQDWHEGKTIDFDAYIDMPDLDDGDYKLAIGFFEDEKNSEPTYKLGNFSIFEKNWYSVANIKYERGIISFSKSTRMDDYSSLLDGFISEDNTKYLPFSTAINYGQNIPEKFSYTISGNVGKEKAGKPIGLSVLNKEGKIVYVYQDYSMEDGTYSFNADISGDIYENTIAINCDGVRIEDSCSIVINFENDTFKVEKVNQNGYIPKELFDKLLTVDIDNADSQNNYFLNEASDEEINFDLTNIDVNSEKWFGDSAFSIGNGIINVQSGNEIKQLNQYISIDYDKYYKVEFSTKGSGKIKLRLYDNWDSKLEAVCSEISGEFKENVLYFKIPSSFYRNAKKPYAKLVFETTSTQGNIEIKDIKISDNQLSILKEINKDGFQIIKNSNVENDAYYYTKRYDGVAEYSENEAHSGVGSIKFDQESPVWGSVAQLVSDRMRKLGNGEYVLNAWFLKEPKNLSSVEPTNLYGMISVNKENGENNETIQFWESAISGGLETGKWKNLSKSFSISDFPSESDISYDYFSLFGIVPGAESNRTSNYTYIDDISIIKKHTDDVHVYGLVVDELEDGIEVGISGKKTYLSFDKNSKPAVFVGAFNDNKLICAESMEINHLDDEYALTLNTTTDEIDTIKVFFWDLNDLSPFEKVECFEIINGKIVHTTTYANDFDVVVLD